MDQLVHPTVTLFKDLLLKLIDLLFYIVSRPIELDEMGEKDNIDPDNEIIFLGKD